MNPGYLSYVWMTCFVILLCSGWRIQLIGHVNRWMVIVFVSLWFILMPITWQITPHITIHLSVILIIMLMINVGRTSSSRTQFALFILFSILLVSWHGFMIYAQRWTPTYLIHPDVDVALGEALLTGAYMKNPLHQITVISWGVMIGLLIEQIWSDQTHIQIGSPNAWDQLLIAVLLTRVFSLLAQWSHNKLYSK
jgi:hypothetical protein